MFSFTTRELSERKLLILFKYYFLRTNLNYNTYKMWALKFTLLLALAVDKLVPLGLDDYKIVSTP